MEVLLFSLFLPCLPSWFFHFILLLGNVYICISRRESQLETGNTYIYQKDWIGSSLAPASPMLPPCYYYLLVTSFSSSSSSSSSSTTYHYYLANNKHLVSCSCLGKRTKEMTGGIEVQDVE